MLHQPTPFWLRKFSWWCSQERQQIGCKIQILVLLTDFNPSRGQKTLGAPRGEQVSNVLQQLCPMFLCANKNYTNEEKNQTATPNGYVPLLVGPLCFHPHLKNLFYQHVLSFLSHLCRHFCIEKTVNSLGFFVFQ